MKRAQVDRSSVRVLQCIDSLGGGGAERQLTYLAEGLVRLGVDVDVAHLRDGEHGPRLRGSGATVHQLGPRSRLQLVADLYRIVRERQIDLVQTWLGARMSFSGGVAARLAGRPWIYSERSVIKLDRCLRAKVLRSMVRGAAAAVVTNGDDGVAWWRDRLGCRAHLIANGIELDAIAATPPADRRALDITDDAELIVYAGRFAPTKNIALLADVLAAVLTRRPRAVAIACGEGDELVRFRARLARAGVRRRCLTPGYRRDLWALLKTADVCIAPSRIEGRPNVVLEAMAARCPLVLSDIAQHRACVSRDAAVWFPVQSLARAVEGLAQTLDDKEAARTRARRAFEQVRGQSIDAMARAHAALYATLTSRAG